MSLYRNRFKLLFPEKPERLRLLCLERVVEMTDTHKPPNLRDFGTMDPRSLPEGL
jgi:hypothetical protein